MEDTTSASFQEDSASAATLNTNEHGSSPAARLHPAESLGNGKDDPLHQILAAVVAFRDGDFSVRLPLAWPGIEGRIAEALNQTIAHEERLTEEVTRLSVTVGKEGRLKQRLAHPVATGSWAIRARSINTLIDDLV